MVPLLGDPPLDQDDDASRGTRSPEPVRHEQDRPVRGGPDEIRHDLLFLDGVDAGEDVIQDEDGRRARDRAGEREPLALSPRHREPALADHGVEALGEAGDFVRDSRRRGGGAGDRAGDVVPSERHVLDDGA